MKKTLLSLALALALAAPCAPALAADDGPHTARNNPVEQFTGAVWQRTEESEKASFLFGVETAITVEYFVNAKLTEKAAKAGKRPVYTLSPFEKGWMKAFKGMNRAQVAAEVDKWYAANPQSLDRPVMEVIWYELIAPRLAAK